MSHTNTNRVPKGVTTGGQFTASVHGEPSGVSLDAPVGNDTPPASAKVVRDTMERMTARETSDGEVTEVERQEDVEADLRAEFPHLSDEEFGERFAAMAKVAERISIVEAAEDTDTEAYEEFGYDYGLEESDFPVPVGEWEPGDGYIDCAAYKAGVIEALDLDLYRQSNEFAEANERAAVKQAEMAATRARDDVRAAS